MVSPRTLNKSAKLPFRPRARLLLLLGDQLIRSAGIAVFELVKNAYDADATHVTLTMRNLEDPDNAVIEVRDDGSGMSWETVTGVWLEPGSGHKEAERLEGKRTKRFKRLPMGEKGVGRFAAHKLGSQVSMVTRTKDSREITLEIDWDRFAAKGKYLDQIKNTVQERTPEVFSGKKTGTLITIRRLRQDWTRGAIRDLARSINSIQSPFQSTGSFRIDLSLPDQSEWLSGILNVREVLKLALYHVSGTIEGNTFKYTYQFRPRRGMKLQGRTVSHSIRIARPDVGRKSDPKPLDLSRFEIGPVRVDLFIYDLAPKVLAASTDDRQGLKDYLAKNGGIRVYRDGVRVFDYAEPGNDWLDLEGRRINRPGLRLSNNLVLGAVTLDRATSRSLVEKTNREGFVENTAFQDFTLAIQSAIVQVEAERKTDKDRLRRVQSPQHASEPILEDLEILRALAEQKGFAKEVSPILKRIEKDYVDIRDTLLTSASAGLSLTIVIHEVEKGLFELKRAIESETHIPLRVRQIAKRLADLVEGLAAIARKSGNTSEKASDLIDQAVFNTELRMDYHKIRLVHSLAGGDFSMKCSRHLTIATLMNLLDNSIWWLDHEKPKTKEIRLFTSRDLLQGPAIIVADNNTLGFIDPPELVTRPFYTRKPGGMGLGLHLADEVMKAQQGHLQFVSAGDVGLPRQYKAVVALVFPEAK